jgi:hypothetical protein
MDTILIMNIEEELHLIKIRQSELMIEERNFVNMREMWRLQIVFEYLRDKFLITEGKGRMH